MRAAGVLLAGTALVAAAWLLLWPSTPKTPPSTPETSGVPRAAIRSGQPEDAAHREETAKVVADDDPGFPADIDEMARRWDDPRYWDAVERYCPWPPDDAASWAVLDGPCLSALSAIGLHDEWRRVFADPTGTRRAVAVALDDPACRVPRGEVRPDLYEACAADAMVLLADLQRKCLEKAHMDWQIVRDEGMARNQRIYDTQEEYHRAILETNRGLAVSLWETYMCRANMDALAWIEAIPEPPGDLADAGRDNFSELIEDGQGGTTVIDLVAPRLTQDVELYALARRLGADVPDWVHDDVLPW